MVIALRYTTIGKERDGRAAYHDGQCSHCGRQFMSDYDRLYVATMTVPGYANVKFCDKCEGAALEFARDQAAKGQKCECAGRDVGLCLACQ